MTNPSGPSSPPGVKVLIRDESLSLPRQPDQSLILPSPDVTLMDVLQARLTLDDAPALDGSSDEEKHRAMLQKALNNIESGRLVVLLNDRQIRDPKERLFVRDGSVLTFVHMTA